MSSPETDNTSICDNIIPEQPEHPKIYVLHHDDADGWGAAAICMACMGEAKYDFVAVPVQYNQPLPDYPYNKNDKVYILDFSYKREILLDLHSKVKELVVIDHHKSAEKELLGLPFVTFDLSKSGVLLAWEYFVPEYPAPDSVMYLNHYDMWKKDDPQYPWEKVVAFHLACTNAFTSMTDWMGLVNGYTIPANFWELGYTHLNYLKMSIQEVKEASTTEFVTIAGKRFAFFFCQEQISLISDAIYNDPELNVDATVCFHQKGGNWIVSARSKNKNVVNVRELAESMGGGGHDLASGFKVVPDKEAVDLVPYVTNCIKSFYSE